MAMQTQLPPPTPAEAVLRRDRWLIAASLAALALAAWVYLLRMGRQMSADAMSGMQGMTETPGMADAMTAAAPWTLQTFALMTAMWSVMMVGMMVPSAAPMVLLFGRVQRRQLADRNPAAATALFTAGYLAIWAVFSVAAAGVQWALTELAWLSPVDLAAAARPVGAALFAAAGLYQLTPLKNACLAQCRSPAEFLSGHWRPGLAGALRMGATHGAFCVGCCWVLMALLFVGGVMNLLWVAAIAALVLLEKLMPRGELVARASGAAMLVAAAAMLL